MFIVFTMYHYIIIMMMIITIIIVISYSHSKLQSTTIHIVHIQLMVYASKFTVFHGFNSLQLFWEL